MPRWVFPEDRAVFVYTGPLAPILEPSVQQGIQIFLEPECQTLALITDTQRALIDGSTVHPGTDGLLPYFYGPPDVTVLYARAIGQSRVYPLDALDASRITDLDAHRVWEGPALPANGERKPPFLWVRTTDSAVFLVVDENFSELLHDEYSAFYGGDSGYIGP